MNKELKDKWISTLKSGKYQKGIGYLRSHDNKYCCFGVLADLLKDKYNFEWDTPRTCNNYSFYYDDKFYMTLLPVDILDSLNGDMDTENTLIQLNDDNNTWDEVINYIEEKL